jgi:hypothetical protein
MSASRSTQAKVADRRARVLRMRMAGLTYASIAPQVGLKTAAAAAMDAARALTERKELLDEQRDLFVTLELERLDNLERHVQTALQGASQAGDHAGVLKATDRLLGIYERRSKLLGLDAQPGKQADPQAPSRVDEIRLRRERKLATG